MTSKNEETIEELSKIKEDLKSNSKLTEYTKNIPDLEKKSLTIVRELKGHFSKIYAMCWSRDSNYILTVSQDGTAKLWDAEKGKLFIAIPLRTSYNMTCCLSPSNQFTATGGLNNLCIIRKVDFLRSQNENQSSKIYRELHDHGGYVSCIKFVDEQFILSSSGDSTCKFWDIEKGRKLVTFSDHTADVMDIDIHYNQNVFLSGACDATSKLWDIRTGECELTFTGHQSDVNCVKFHPNYQAFGTCSDDSTCKLFDLRTTSQISEYTNEDTQQIGTTSLDFSCSGRLLFTSYDDNLIRVWDVLKQKLHSVLNKHSSRVSRLSVSYDGSALCSAGWDKNIYVWA
ncbi:guanine nucleotide-binding protein beta g protein beta [Anaeramoeba flamelloides]|uniref:Guanine nucleotide-binding protein beta g protein beta n=1 Tax=Anaeramoeba flamelloides TaxID=1746091 RepID=A0ABQ8YDE7_9EUKA|nr:guanine nucleotide-binding protein beta g protein beta [Anaeramoeba flamelloides]